MASVSISGKDIVRAMDRGINGLASKLVRCKNLDPQYVERYTKITAYNIKQVAFNAVTIAALAVVLFAGIALLPLGPALLIGGILYIARELIRESVDRSLKSQRAIIEEHAISGFIDHPLPKDWNAVALSIFEVPLWRNTISLDFPKPAKKGVEDSNPSEGKEEVRSDDMDSLAAPFSYATDPRSDSSSSSFSSFYRSARDVNG